MALFVIKHIWNVACEAIWFESCVLKKSQPVWWIRTPTYRHTEVVPTPPLCTSLVTRYPDKAIEITRNYRSDFAIQYLKISVSQYRSRISCGFSCQTFGSLPNCFLGASQNFLSSQNVVGSQNLVAFQHFGVSLSSWMSCFDLETP